MSTCLNNIENVKAWQSLTDKVEESSTTHTIIAGIMYLYKINKIFSFYLYL